MQGQTLVGRFDRTDHGAFLDALASAIEDARASHQRLDLLLVQIRDFGRTNRVHGYETGDMAIVWIASQLSEGLRGNAHVARIGGSRFAVTLRGLGSPSLATLAAYKVQRLLNKRIPLAGHAVSVEVAQGLSSFPEQAPDAESLLISAETALQRSLDSHTPIVIHESDQASLETRSQRLESILANALSNGGIEPYFQPQVQLATRQVVGAEALLRCNDDDGAALPAELIVETAERMHVLSDVTVAMLNAALRYAAQWPSAAARPKVSVNVGPPTLRDPDFVDIVGIALGVWDTQPEQLTIEITESAFITDPERSFDVMRALRNIGIRIAIDDFGTGYSSLSYFKNIPANELKIDKCFVMNIDADAADLKLVRTVVNLAHEFGLEVVAEGIENEATLDTLCALRCDIGQGYYFGRPMTAPQFLEWLSARPSRIVGACSR